MPVVDRLSVKAGPKTMGILSEDDARRFSENGYLSVPDVVPHANLEAAIGVAMHPVADNQERHERVQLWNDKRPPSWWRPWPNQIDLEPGEPARLGELGRKLVGLDHW